MHMTILAFGKGMGVFAGWVGGGGGPPAGVWTIPRGPTLERSPTLIMQRCPSPTNTYRGPVMEPKGYDRRKAPLRPTRARVAGRPNQRQWVGAGRCNAWTYTEIGRGGDGGGAWCGRRAGPRQHAMRGVVLRNGTMQHHSDHRISNTRCTRWRGTMIATGVRRGAYPMWCVQRHGGNVLACIVTRWW